MIPSKSGGIIHHGIHFLSPLSRNYDEAQRGTTALQIEIDSLVKLREIIAAEIQDRIDHLKTKHNQSLPIHTLPAELFIDILLTTLDTPSHWEIDQTIRLTQVSRYWRNTVNVCQRFWPLIDYDTPEENEIVLRKNVSGPLWVKCDLDYWDEAEQEDDVHSLEEFLEIASANHARWRSATFSWINQTRWIGPFLESGAGTSLLEELFVEHTPEEVNPVGYATLPPTYAPRLRRLALGGLPLTTWELGAYRNLESLSLEITDGRQPSVQQLRSLLASIPNICQLHLSSSYLPNPPDSPDTHVTAPTSPIHLSHLQSLSIRGLRGDFIRLLATVKSPRCRTVLIQSITSEYVRDSLQLCAIALRHTKIIHVNNIVPNEPANPISLASPLPPSSRMVWAGTDIQQAGFSLQIPRHEFAATWLGVLSTLEQISGAKLAIRIRLGHDGGPYSPFYGFTDSKFPLIPLGASAHVRSIWIGNYSHPVEVIRHLASQLDSGDGTKTWPCPNLVELDLRSSPDKRLVAETKSFIDRRYMGSGSNGDAVTLGGTSTFTTAPKPAMLKRVGLGEGEEWDEVKAILVSLEVEVIGQSDEFPGSDL